jgi:hypothetical protein
MTDNVNVPLPNILKPDKVKTPLAVFPFHTPETDAVGLIVKVIEYIPTLFSTETPELS